MPEGIDLQTVLQRFLALLSAAGSALPPEMKAVLLQTNDAACGCTDKDVAANLLEAALEGRWDLDPADLVLILHCACRLIRAEGGPCHDVLLFRAGPDEPPGRTPIPKPSMN